MNKVLPISLALCFLLALGTAESATLTVCASGCDNTSIQDAIDASSADGIIQVGDGTYTEDLLVASLSNLTIESVNGSAVTTIQCVDGVCIDVRTNSHDFTLGGASGKGFTVTTNADNTTFLFQLTHRLNDTTLSYNTFDSVGGATMGISIGDAGAQGLTIVNNTFTADTGDGSIWMPIVNDVTITGNTFTADATNSGYAVEASGITGTSVISGNSITDYGMGVAIFHGEGASGLTISDNTITGCNTSIRLGQYKATGGSDGDLEDITISDNTVSNDVNAIRIHPDGANVNLSAVTIEHNSFTSSSSYAVKNEHTSGMLDVTFNWWGMTSPNTSALASGNVTMYPPCAVVACTFPAEFTGASSTNFSAITDWSAVDLVLDGGAGTIDWESNVNLSESGLEFDASVDISFRSITIDSATMPELDSQAQLTFKGTGFENFAVFEIYKDGSVCGVADCFNVSIVNTDDVVMNVSGFSTYTLVGGALYQNLDEAGSGLGGFLTYITSPLVSIILGLGLVGGILAIFYGVASAIRRAVGGATAGIGK